MRAALCAFFGLGCAPASDLDLEALRAPPEGSERAASYAGRVPCVGAPDACQRVKVSLTLHHDIALGSPTAYVLEWIYVGVDDQRHTAAGTWTQTTGLPWDERADVIVLSDGGELGFDWFVRIREEVLLPLDEDGELLLGDEGYANALTVYDP